MNDYLLYTYIHILKILFSIPIATNELIFTSALNPFIWIIWIFFFNSWIRPVPVMHWSFRNYWQFRLECTGSCKIHLKPPQIQMNEKKKKYEYNFCEISTRNSAFWTFNRHQLCVFFIFSNPIKCHSKLPPIIFGSFQPQSRSIYRKIFIIFEQ